MSIVLKDVCKVYQTGEIKTEALKKVNLAIEDGEFIVILGPSGSGKSTLLNVISGLDTVTSGTIKYNHKIISKLSVEELTKFRRENLGFIFQQYNLLQNLNVEDNVRMGSDISSNPLNVDEVLKQVGLYSMKEKYVYQLSGGEQQRVSIARSIAKNPKIMFCDEPTGSLDEETGKQVLEVLEMLNEKYKTTMVVITHNPNIGQMADKVIKMNSGFISEIKENNKKQKAKDISWS